MAQNKDEGHILALTGASRQSREDLIKIVLDNIFPNDNKLVTPEMVRTALRAIIKSVANWNDDNLDLRAYQCDDLQVTTTGQTLFKLSQTPVNPAQDAILSVDGLVQTYGADYSITGDELTFIPSSQWSLKPYHKVTLQYRYFLAAPSGGSPGGGTGGGSTGGTVQQFKHSFTGTDQIIIDHNLNKYPTVLVLINNKPVTADIEYPTENRVIVRFLAPNTGLIVYS